MALSASWYFIHTVAFLLLLSFTVRAHPILALRFLIVVLSAYKQMRAQSKDVLCDIGEDNFDKAFSFLRPGMSRIYYQTTSPSHPSVQSYKGTQTLAPGSRRLKCRTH